MSHGTGPPCPSYQTPQRAPKSVALLPVETPPLQQRNLSPPSIGHRPRAFKSIGHGDASKARSHPKTCFVARSSEKLVGKAGGGKGSEAC